MKCPRCGGEKCQYMTTSETHSKNFSSGDACCGLLVFGPAGLLCGLCGNESHTKVKEYWVCHDCGNKFNAKREMMRIEELSQLDKLEYKIHFYQEFIGTNSLQKNVVWSRVQDGYKKYIYETILDSYFLKSTPYEVNRVYIDIVKKYVKKMKQNVNILFAVIEDKGLLLTTEGFFINDCFISNNTLKSILLYRNIIFINRIAFELNTIQEAEILFEFLVFLYPQTRNGREIYMEEAVEKLRILDNKNHSDSGEAYFNKNQQYIDYVARMTDDYVEYYLKLHPEVPYDRYLKVKKRQNLVVNVMVGVQIFLAIILFLTVGIAGLMISIGIFVVFFLWLWKEAWRKPFAKLLPTEMENLLRENDYHVGTISLLEYKYVIDEMRKQLE